MNMLMAQQQMKASTDGFAGLRRKVPQACGTEIPQPSQLPGLGAQQPFDMSYMQIQ